MVYGIVRNHHGQVLVNSTPGLGTTVRIYLPAGRRARAVAPAPAPPVDRETPAMPEALPGRTAPDPLPVSADPALGADARPCVLVVDDEPVLRAMMQDVLEAAGYKVIMAADGIEALEQYRHAGGRG